LRSASSSSSRCRRLAAVLLSAGLWIRTLAAGVPLSIGALIRMRVIGVPPA